MSQTKLTDSCDHCVYSELSPNVYPCSKCSSQQKHFTPDPICQKCEHADTPVAEYPCQTCRDESGRRHYIESTESTEPTESTELPSPCQSCPHAGGPLRSNSHARIVFIIALVPPSKGTKKQSTSGSWRK